MTAGIGGLLQSLRLWTRVTELLTRLHETSVSTSDHSSNPFEVSETPASHLKSEHGKLNAMQWKAAEVCHLISSCINVSNCSFQYMTDVQLTLGRIYCTRGSLCEAEYFLDKALVLAQTVGAWRIILRAKLDLGEAKLLSSSQEVGEKYLSEVDLMVENVVFSLFRSLKCSLPSPVCQSRENGFAAHFRGLQSARGRKRKCCAIL